MLVMRMLLILYTLGTVSPFRHSLPVVTRNFALSAAGNGPRALHKTFTVEPATPTKLEELDVLSWPTWCTDGTAKYKTGVRSPLKVYDTNELSYVTKGQMEITPADAKTGEAIGEAVLVSPGDFVTFPDGFACYWFVKQAVTKHWHLY